MVLIFNWCMQMPSNLAKVSLQLKRSTSVHEKRERKKDVCHPVVLPKSACISCVLLQVSERAK